MAAIADGDGRGGGVRTAAAGPKEGRAVAPSFVEGLCVLGVYHHRTVIEAEIKLVACDKSLYFAHILRDRG